MYCVLMCMHATWCVHMYCVLIVLDLYMCCMLIVCFACVHVVCVDCLCYIVVLVCFASDRISGKSDKLWSSSPDASCLAKVSASLAKSEIW